jgi:ADP-heptose:LPS heptosyltransferase
MRLLSKAPHNIVILRALQLGDMLCAVPALRALRTAYPAARITLVGLPWADAFVQRFSTYLDDFIAFPGWPGFPEQEPHLERIPAFLQRVQARQFDLALQMQGAGTISNPLIALFGARQTAGYYLPDQYQADERLFIPYPHGESEIRVFLRLMEHLGFPAQGEALEFPLFEEEQLSYERFQAEHGFEPGAYACLHPGARFAGRRWPSEKFAATGDALAEQGLRVVLTGTAQEAALTHAVARRMRAPVLDAAGKTDLGTLAILLQNARILISNDTGVSHMAAAFETPSVILFAASEIERWRPLNHALHRIVPNADQAGPEEVLAAAIPLLKEGRTYAQHPV